MSAEPRKIDEWMPLYVDKYLGDTTHLTTELHGAYLLLLMAGWKRGGRLPVDDTQLAAIARMTPAKWRSAKRVLLAFFRRDDDGSLVQKRLTIEVERATRLSIVRAEAGQIGGRSRSKPPSKTEANAKQTAKQNSKQNASNDEANRVANGQANVMQKGDTGGSPPSASNPLNPPTPSVLSPPSGGASTNSAASPPAKPKPSRRCPGSSLSTMACERGPRAMFAVSTSNARPRRFATTSSTVRTATGRRPGGSGCATRKAGSHSEPCR